MLINSVLDKYRNTDKWNRVTTKTTIVGTDIHKDLTDYLNKYYPDAIVGIICDKNTYEAAGKRLSEYISTSVILVFELTEHHAELYMIEEVKEKIKDVGINFGLLLACGSGTVHDITRAVAFHYNIPFISYPTAASVDGFNSSVVPLTIDGMKTTIDANAPVAVFADLSIISKAPKRLSASGAGDLLGKYIALADWKISHILTGEAIDLEIVDFVNTAIKQVELSIDNLQNGDKNEFYFCEKLIDSLLVSGLAIQLFGNSRPASSAEHHLAHLWEMGTVASCHGYHGENVGVGTVIICDLYHEFFKAPKNVLKFDFLPMLTEPELCKYFGQAAQGVKKECYPDFTEYVTAECFFGNYDKIKSIINEIPSSEKIISLLSRTGAVSDIYDIIDLNSILSKEDVLSKSIMLAPYLRQRLSLLKIITRL